jgi:hypothetical protein
VLTLTAFKAKNTRVKCIIILAILLASTGIVSGYATTLQSQNVPLEVKEPLEILMSNQSLNVYPGETLPLTVKVENHASVSYNATLTFSLNDTGYQAQYVIFSKAIYEVQPGINDLDAWLTVSSTAPAAELELTINITRNIEALPTPTPSPTQPPTNLNPSMTLFAAGAKWAANNGTSVLYINWYDNYCAHHLTDPNWGPYWREGQLPEIKNTTVNALEQQGFKVTCMGDVPADLSSYNLVIFEAWFAVEPKHSQLARGYLSNGGNVVIIGGVPCYFSTYCKDLWPYVTGGENLAALKDWFGSAEFVNSGGTASLIVDQPFGTLLRSQSVVYHIDAYGCYALTSISNDTQIIARWANGPVYSFTHEYAGGRVYYQAEMDW